MQGSRGNFADFDKIIENEKRKEVRKHLQAVVNAAKKGDRQAIQWLREHIKGESNR